jgi:AcrR family transcriptional regulator
VSVSAIGKQLGVSGPALYRYFTSRDELLTELVIDAYRRPSCAPSSHGPACTAS